MARDDEILSLPRVACSFARPYRTIFRLLLALHERDHAAGAGGWLFRLGDRKHMVNLGMLRRAHPELFHLRALHEEESAVQNRLDVLEEKNAADTSSRTIEKRRLNSAFARIRRLEKILPDPATSDTSEGLHH
jgi:hypothetical protein